MRLGGDGREAEQVMRGKGYNSVLKEGEEMR